MVLASITEVFGFTHMTLLPVFAKEVLGVGPVGLGFMTAVRQGGGLIGLFFLANLKDFQNDNAGNFGKNFPGKDKMKKAENTLRTTSGSSTASFEQVDCKTSCDLTKINEEEHELQSIRDLNFETHTFQDFMGHMTSLDMNLRPGMEVDPQLLDLSLIHI